MSNATENKIVEIPLSLLRYDTAEKVRCGVDQATIDHYAELWKEYKKDLNDYESQPADAKTPTVPTYPFPSIWVAEIESDGKKVYDCISGQHRARSAIKAGVETIRIGIAKETSDEWLKMAVKANQGHGRPYTSEDVKQCVISLVKEYPKSSCRDMAKLIGCSKSLAARILKEINEPSLTTKAEKAAAKPKAEPEDDVIDEDETTEEESLQLTPKWCDDVLGQIQDSEKPDKPTSNSLCKLAAGIVDFLVEHGSSVKSLQKKLAAIGTAK